MSRVRRPRRSGNVVSKQIREIVGDFDGSAKSGPDSRTKPHEFQANILQTEQSCAELGLRCAQPRQSYAQPKLGCGQLKLGCEQPKLGYGQPKLGRGQLTVGCGQLKLGCGQPRFSYEELKRGCVSFWTKSR